MSSGALPKRFWIAAALALLGGLAVGIGVVSARASFETNALIFNTSTSQLYGLVTSPEPDCMPRRQVSMVRRKSGPDEKVGSDKTDVNGNYLKDFNHALHHGSYYAKVKKRRIDAGLCQRGDSGDVNVP